MSSMPSAWTRRYATTGSRDSAPRTAAACLSGASSTRTSGARGFSKSRVLGSSLAGTIYHGTFDDGLEVAARVINTQLDTFEDEVRLLSRCHHPNIVMLLGFAIENGQDTQEKHNSSTGRSCALVYEFLPRGNINFRLHSLEVQYPWRERLRTAIDITRGFVHLHKHRPEVFHRNISTKNILFAGDGSAKIADFRLACAASAAQRKEEVWSIPSFHVPRLSTGDGTTPVKHQPGDTSQPAKQVADEADEVHAVGLVFLELLTARRPGFVIAQLGCDAEHVKDQILPFLDERAASQQRPDFLEIITALLKLARTATTVGKDTQKLGTLQQQQGNSANNVWKWFGMGRGRDGPSDCQLSCPRGHTLERSTLTSPWVCNECKTYNTKTDRFRCHACDYDLCTTCFWEAKQAVAGGPKSEGKGSLEAESIPKKENLPPLAPVKESCPKVEADSKTDRNEISSKEAITKVDTNITPEVTVCASGPSSPSNAPWPPVPQAYGAQAEVNSERPQEEEGAHTVPRTVQEPAGDGHHAHGLRGVRETVLRETNHEAVAAVRETSVREAAKQQATPATREAPAWEAAPAKRETSLRETPLRKLSNERSISGTTMKQCTAAPTPCFGETPPKPDAAGDAAERRDRRAESPAEMKVRCPNNHVLDLSALQAAWFCDECKKTHTTKMHRYRCHLCDYDLCRQCCLKMKQAIAISAEN
eukprot:CAMPEP_0179312784 /NCGR_PEP_ID=MMETSP0797-20121207/53458_1 /TAXON_ID=47934 /ORGANISM="Dinophysis acuminata, Strain DAEP01" /LENGTH=703 /DNA_ID=CAMNT_0021022755 /DNA_START=52 /DNA_END=2159 /DNA_ORIENTATION=+